MRRHSGKVRLIVVVLAAMLATLTHYAKPHLSSSIKGAVISYNGTITTSSSVYRIDSQTMAVRLIEQNERQVYVIYLSEGPVGIPNGDSIVFLPGGIAYCKDMPLGAVIMDGVKTDRVSDLIRVTSGFEFTTWDGSRIRVTLPIGSSPFTS